VEGRYGHGGLSLFGADGQPQSRGTEIDEEVGVGPDVAPQQLMPDQGPMDPVRQVREVPAAEYGLPASAHIRVTLAPM
jgi:hypothetical protein